jgi:hypothetical protein
MTEMPVADPSLSAWMTLSALGIITLVAFLVSWVLTDLVHLPRAAYLAALMIVTAALMYGYLAWSGTDAVAFLTQHWGWGLVGAVVSGGLGARGIAMAANRRGVPHPAHRGFARMSEDIAWEGLLYGAAEGVLLSVLPVLAAWQSLNLLGWTDTTAGAIGSGALAVAASLVVIWVHHLGYREFRGTRQIVMPIIGCGVLSLAYMLTFSPIAPVGGHVLGHVGMETRGVPMPPYSTWPAAQVKASGAPAPA